MLFQKIPSSEASLPLIMMKQSVPGHFAHGFASQGPFLYIPGLPKSAIGNSWLSVDITEVETTWGLVSGTHRWFGYAYPVFFLLLGLRTRYPKVWHIGVLSTLNQTQEHRKGLWMPAKKKTKKPCVCMLFSQLQDFSQKQGLSDPRPFSPEASHGKQNFFPQGGSQKPEPLCPKANRKTQKGHSLPFPLKTLFHGSPALCPGGRNATQ